MLLAGLLALLLCLWLTRYQYITAEHGVYRVNRWTGEIIYFELDEAYRVKMPK